MNKKSTLILLSSIFMSGLAARPTLQDVRKAIPTLKDVRNTVTVRNACRLAGVIAGDTVGCTIGYVVCGHATDFVSRSYSGHATDFVSGNNELADFIANSVGKPLGSFFGVCAGFFIGGKLHDRYQAYKANKEAAANKS